MKYISANYKFICKRTIFLVLFFLGLNLQAQDIVFRDGIQQGVVKVKFEPQMTTTLSQMQVKTKGKSLSTGITTFDKAINTIKAFNMERIIPECPNPVLEAKHRKAGLHLWYFVEFDKNIDPQTAIKTLKAVPGVKSVEYEHSKKLIPSKITPYTAGRSAFSSLPFNDPLLKDQWHYINTGQLGLPGDKADANLKEAWKVTAGRSDVIVAIQDEGVDVNHEDLKANMWVNTAEIPGNGIDDDGNGYIDDIHGFNFVKLTGEIDAQSHGTHVAGTVAAVNNNSTGVSGVAGGTGKGDGAKIMALQIIGGATAGHILRSYVYAADMGAVISQNSWGYNGTGIYEQDVLDGIDYFINTAGDYSGSPMKGGMVIFASGNDSAEGEYWPGVYEKCFSVSAIGPEGKIAKYSNYAKWVEISAPGGDIDTYGVAKSGVLSTLPGNQYGYMQGTSMACPHVSGIAALSLASSSKQLTKDELWTRLLTSVTDVEKNNPSYIGKLGSGTIDAGLAVCIDGGKAPNQITTLTLKGIAQEFATLEWKVPSDEDDTTPILFNIYYSTEPITDSNLAKASKLELKNTGIVGETISFEINKLLGTTKYYFGVVSADRWGNKSAISNIITGTTNNGPTIDVNTGSENKTLSLSTDVSQSATANKDFRLLNRSEGVLRWEYLVRNTGHQSSIKGYSSKVYPQITSTPKGVKMTDAPGLVKKVRSSEPVASTSFKTIEKKYVEYTTIFVGDTDPMLPTSGAIKYIVNEEEGFNLTQVKTEIQYTLGTGPIIVEVYKDELSADKLVCTEEYQPANSWTYTHFIPLKEHIYFEKGSVFYIVVHVPQGNGYSLGIGVETSPEYSDYCYYSSDYGAKWDLLVNVGIPQVYAWDIRAVSQYPHLSEFIELDPASGNVSGNSEETIKLKANASSLINGSYNANIIFKSNDSKNAEYRMPVVFDVAGHKPNLVYPKIVDFGSVFKDDETTVDIVLENIGYGLVNELKATIDNAQFTVVAEPSTVEARSESTIRVKFSPTSTGNINGKLTISNGQYSYQISLFGVGAETSQIEITPASQTIDNIAIGDVINSSFSIKNTGHFPLKYFIPGYDTEGISENWTDGYHHYGYSIRSNNTNIKNNDSIKYEFDDISSTGININNTFIDGYYHEVEFGFDFPYYGEIQNKIYITKNGYTTFDTSAFPYNTPKLKGGLKGYISMMGYPDVVKIKDGKVLYKAESDRLIIQYDNLEYIDERFTAQMVLFANGNIRFYYKKLPTGEFASKMTTILIEDIAQTDGILVREYQDDFILNDGTVVGFDYPGPNIISAIENGSGIVAPNQSIEVKVTMNTETLPEGVTTRNVNVISNDPKSTNTIYSALLNVTSGGVENYSLSTDTVDFDVVYQGVSYTKEFAIRNSGSKFITVSSLVFDNTKFTVSGKDSIAPGINEIYKVSPNTANITTLNDLLKITFSDGNTKEIRLIADVRNVPVIDADLSPVSADLEIDGKKTIPFEISNTGGSNLDVSIINGQWFQFEETTKTPVSQYDYFVKMENNGQPSYNWVDIIKTGTKIAYDAQKANDKKVFWTDITLPFSLPYYGTEYSNIKVGYNGIMSLGGDPEALTYPRAFPIEGEDKDASFICPLWSAGGFDTQNFPDVAGIYYQTFDDKIVVSWLYFINLFGWGQSTQAILYKDGTIKFQYKLSSGTTDGSGSGTIAIQNTNESGQYTLISKNTRQTYGQGLAYLIVPDNKHTVTPGEKMEGNIIIDASNIYGGNFKDSLVIQSNDPIRPILSKPLSVKVNGTAKIEAPTEIDLGDTEVVFNSSEYYYKSIIKPLVITNTGTAPFRVTNARMETGGKYLTQLVLTTGISGSQWAPLENLRSYPEQLLLPGESFNSYARFAPEVAGTYEDNLIINTSMGDIKVKLSGFGYDSPVINVDNSPIDVSFNTMDQTESRSITFDNNDGGYKLDYDILIKYKRGIEDAETESKEEISNSKPDSSVESSILTVNEGASVATRSSVDEFNRKIQYVDHSGINNAMGNQGTTSTIVATKFVADKTGFTLSDVGTYANIDKGTNGTIAVEIRVGGDNITNALPVATGSIVFEYPKDGVESQIISKYNLALDEPVQVLPNEEFYVIFSYPMDLTFPQTIQLGNVDIAPERYWWFNSGEWSDLQEYLAAFNPNAGFVMYAGERNYKESGWIKLLTPDSGTLQKGETTKTDIKLVASFAERGDQKADIIIKSNDVNASVVEIPVSLHMNEAPSFTEVPSSVMIAEKDTMDLEIAVKDKEAHNFNLEITEKPEFVSHSKNKDNKSILAIAPDYGHTGTHKVTLKATDEHNAVNEHTIEIHVSQTNRVPRFIGSTTEFRFDAGATPSRISIKDLFEDPDGDDFTFTVTCADNTVAEVYQSGTEYFLVEPKASGETTMTFVVTDVYGGSATHPVQVIVESCIPNEGLIVQKWNNALLLNNSDNKYVAYQWYKNSELIAGATKQYYAEKEGELDFDAEYYVRLTTADGKSVFTCPLKPVRKGISLNAYPNPVRQGQSVTIETQLPDIESNPITIQIVNISGHVIRTITTKNVQNSVEMPYESGSYLIKVSNSTVEKTFNILIQ